MNETRSEYINIPVTPTEKEAVKQAADDDERTMTDYARLLIIKQLKKDKYL